jgi:hypothetical protein
VLVERNGSEERRAALAVAPLQPRAKLRQARHLCRVAAARSLVQRRSVVT